MKTSAASSISVALFFSLAFAAIAAPSVVQQTCKASAAKSPNLNFDFCVRALAAVPASDAGDLFRLGAGSLSLIEKSVSSTSSFIEGLLKKPVAAAVAPALKDCGEMFSDAGETMGEVRTAYMAKDFGGANVKLSSVMDAIRTCEDGFKEKGAVSPLVKQNADAFQLTVIALSIMNMNK